MKKLIPLLLLMVFTSIGAQKITDGQTVTVDGLAVTFNILNKESVTAGGKNYDRYKVSATLVNNSGKDFNLRMSNAPQVVTNTELVELNCINATGAKLTSKKLTLKMNPQNLNVTYWAYTKDGKYQSFVIPVVSGYFLDNGGSVSDNAIFIVPQGQAPDVTVRKTL
ncbi:hypothetical protein NG800_008025 [Epilithonimonas ginsengisoli]|uniref:DUF4352 domain-containing protein n=1 Tax=Epilithonimonas ginsengisoli TaxID=1245592 RepID=A0ABU4JGP5_9FLAO|nr:MULTISPECIES: hypothetical protein [Chryseobacterium group]MBV6880121.1 hypothetical protein [Epilithonimonas sp. FP105]MDW8548854.1 hypothetical protein [Epilithonimonas ginsengisoli]OAH76229.1 hypothetical protein AXA65_01720 [Chryseobacterium sp. FP211-J200]